MAEKSVWTYLRDKFDFGLIERHEDSITLGVADTSYNFINCYCDDNSGKEKYGRYAGWIELKEATFPKRESTRIKVKFEPMQKPWLKLRGMNGADCWVMVRVDKVYMLFYWLNIETIGEVNYEELVPLADKVWPRGFTSIELKEALMKRGDSF